MFVEARNVESGQPLQQESTCNETQHVKGLPVDPLHVVPRHRSARSAATSENTVRVANPTKTDPAAGRPRHPKAVPIASR